LLAAGESTRMGDLKALLAWEGGQPLIEYQVEQLLATAVERVVVVLGHRAGELRRLLPIDARLTAVDNPDFHSGKVSSIVAGARACDATAHVLVIGVDQPRPAELVERTVTCHVSGVAPITIAGYGGRRGHPVIFAPALRNELVAIDEATQGLRAVLQRHASNVAVCETDSPLALVNLNSPDDYAAARRLAGLD
jgi:molybdenum cofactor cytidylyltransferase